MKIAFFLAKSYSYVFLRKTRKQLCLYLTLDHIYTIKNTILIIQLFKMTFTINDHKSFLKTTNINPIAKSGTSSVKTSGVVK
jgi:hypothetical protein